MPTEKEPDFFDTILGVAESIRGTMDQLPEPEEISNINDDDDDDDHRKRQRTKRATLIRVYRDSGVIAIWHVDPKCGRFSGVVSHEASGGVPEIVEGQGVEFARMCPACLSRLLIRNR